MKKLIIRPVALVILLSGLSMTESYAGGIPVIDTASNAQNAAHYVKELAEMAKQLSMAKNQLTQLKSQLKAMTGFKGFVDVLQQGGLDTELLTSYEDLLNGDTSAIMKRAEETLGDIDCSKAKDEKICKSSVLSNISSLNYLEKLSRQFDAKINRITELSQKAQSATDVKSMAEVQAAISLEANSIAMLQQQRQAFKDIAETKQRLYMQKSIREYGDEEVEQYLKDVEGSTNTTNYNRLLGK